MQNRKEDAKAEQEIRGGIADLGYPKGFLFAGRKESRRNARRKSWALIALPYNILCKATV
jgi:hypothetical protein